MTEPVIDASIALAWLLQEKRDARTDPTFVAFAEDGGYVPQHWHYEVRNGLLIAVRRLRLSQDDAMGRLRLLRGIHVSTDLEPDLDETLQLALTHALTFYDALYLELAVRRDLPLSTLDNDLAHAARDAGVEVHPT